MAILFVQIAKLHKKSGGIKGRSDYITDPGRQEEILCASHPDWSDEIEFEHSRGGISDVIEGRELVISLPNEWYYDYKERRLSFSELTKRIDELAMATLKTKRTEQTGIYPKFEYALHFNTAGNYNDDTGEKYPYDNFNMHLVFSERIQTGGVKYYTKDVYYTDEGKIAVRSVNRAKDENGNDKPPKHRKGEVKSNATFSNKDREYSDNEFESKCKLAVKKFFEGYGFSFKDPGYFHTYHHGKGSESNDIKAKNARLKEMNNLYEKGFYIFPEKYDENNKLTAEYKEFLYDLIDLNEKNKPAILAKHAKKVEKNVPKPEPALESEPEIRDITGLVLPQLPTAINSEIDSEMSFGVENYVPKPKVKSVQAITHEPEVIPAPISVKVVEPKPVTPQNSVKNQSDIYTEERMEALSKKVEAAKLEAALKKERKHNLLFSESDKLVVGGGDFQGQAAGQVNGLERGG